MKRLSFSPVITALTLLSAVVMQAAAGTLKVGDTAPRLETGKWVQGDPVKAFEKGTTYIVEFWATWCGPCRATIPHVNALQKKFQDQKLVVIGQDVWERDETKVEPFVKQMGDKMTYRVALDDKRQTATGAMAKNWMEAAGQNGIPSAFVINKEGKIAWIGHPAALNESMLGSMIDGTFDLEKAAAEQEAAQRRERDLARVSGKLSRAKSAGNWDDAESALQELETILPPEQQRGLGMLRAEIAFGRGDYPMGYQHVEKFADSMKDNAQLQNQIAWYLATDKKLKQRDLALAEKLARRAVAGTDEKEAALLDTLARVQFMADRKAEAVKTQTKAVEAARGDLKEQLQATLDSYKAGKLPSSE